MIPIAKIRPNHDQPRKDFRAEEIEELASSIREKGILQPVIVKQIQENDYELVCGERRMKAASLCGLSEVPAIVKELADDELLEWALIENIQRQDLNPLEEAEAYRRLSDERMISHELIAKKLGKSRTTITNTLRLLRLPEEVKIYLAEGRLSAGHARALLGLLTPEHQRQMARRIVEENLTVRQIEGIVNRSLAHKRKAKRARLLTPEVLDLENRMSQHLGTQVKIFPRKNQKQGRIEFYYYSLDDLDRIIQKMNLPQG
ncbi:MAG: ParB/RepB/Spo0J family partition protein [Candidatus Omnitrophota bacterium]